MIAPTTVDAVLDGAVVLEQPAHGHGYRFNVDAVLLAQFAARAHPTVHRLVDLGAGVGAVAICVAHLTEVGRLLLIDSNAQACEVASRNLARAGLEARGTVLNADVSDAPTRAADLVVANPPYTAPGKGRRAKHASVDRARHGDLGAFIAATSATMADADARGCLCVPPGRLVELCRIAARHELTPVRLAFVTPPQSSRARLVLIELARSRKEMAVVMEPRVVG